MNTRSAYLLGLGLVWSAASAFLACGSSPSGGTDGGPDASNDNTTKFDVPHPDQKNPIDSPPSDSPLDGGSDVVTKMDSGIVGNCSPVNSAACDIVLQNCKSGEECVVVNDTTAESGLGVTTACQPVLGTEHLQVGEFCCPTGGSNQCAKGTTCVGNPCIGDAGSGGGGGRCSPACCPSDGGPNTANCGASYPEGYGGVCDLSLTGTVKTTADPTGTLYNACTYESTCIPFVKPCGPGYSCIVTDKSGKSNCTGINEPDGSTVGLPAGSGCMFANECAPDLECITFLYSDGGMPPLGTCTYLCYMSGGSPPFDAGALKGTPGSGGCPTGKTCSPASFLPSWLGVCG